MENIDDLHKKIKNIMNSIYVGCRVLYFERISYYELFENTLLQEGVITAIESDCQYMNR